MDNPTDMRKATQKESIKVPANIAESGHCPKSHPDNSGEKGGGWKVFIFLLPGRSENPSPKLPKGKNWLELLLLLIKVIAAIVALIKGAGLLS